MALDFHSLDDKKYLFELNDNKYNNLVMIFKEFKHRTGIFIDQYSDAIITVENQLLLLKIIDQYIEKTNLNQDKQKTVDILEIRGLLAYFSSHKVGLSLLGD